jgi:hypothetical protein
LKQLSTIQGSYSSGSKTEEGNGLGMMEFHRLAAKPASAAEARAAPFMSCSFPSCKMICHAAFATPKGAEEMSGIGSRSAVAAAVILATIVSGATATRAENGRIAAGIAGGLIGGALIGGALAGPPVYAAPPPPPAYYAPTYESAPVYVEEPACRLVREQFWDGYGYRVRRYRVCD